MKQLFVVCLFFVSFFGICQVTTADRVLFNYDISGNQTIRKLCFPCNQNRSSNEVRKEISQLEEKDLLKFFPEDVISYYPNPVQEELYLKWELINNNAVSKIDIYSLNGQLVRSFAHLEKENSKTISFQEYPAGSYSVLLYYTNGEKKPITIIKQ